HRTRDYLISNRQHYAVSRYSQWSFVNDSVAFCVIALIVFVGLDDDYTIFAERRNRMFQMDSDVLAFSAEPNIWIINFRLRRRHNFELQRLSGSCIYDRFIRSLAPFANRIVMK